MALRARIAVIAALAGVGGAAFADRASLEGALQTRLTGTEVRPRPGARLWWWRDAEQPIAGLRTNRNETFARLAAAGHDRVRMRIDAGAAQLSVYIYATDLEPLASRRALVHPSQRRALATAGPRTPGIHLHPGAPLELIRSARRGRARKVAVDHLGIRGRGFIDASAVGIDFARAARPSIGRTPRRALLAKTQLRDRPGGAVIARIDPESGSSAVRLLETRGGHALVAYHAPWSTAIGWVERSAIGPAVGIGGGGTGWGSISGRGQSVELAAGTLLFVEPDTNPVGVVNRTSSYPLVERSGADWKHIRLATDFGSVDLWASNARVP